MNDFNNQQMTDWLTHARKAIAAQSLRQFVSEISGEQVRLQWVATDIESPELAQFKQEVSALASRAIAASELRFVQQYPQAAAHELFLKSVVPLLVYKEIDWLVVEQQIQQAVKQFYHTDISAFGADIIKRLADDLYICICVRDQRDQLLGFCMAAITPSLPYGEIKIMHLIADAPNRSLIYQLLLGGLFQIIPNAQRLFIGVRPTNTDAVEALSGLGFRPVALQHDPNHAVNVHYFTVLEYLTAQSTVLQEIAKRLR